MFKNYIKVAWRNVRKNKLFSTINILGLSIGIGLCFIIMLYVIDELSYDRFNKNSNNIARIVFDANIDGGRIYEASVMAPVAQALKNDFPEVNDATRMVRFGSPKITYGDKTFKNDEVALADPNFFTVFTLPFLEGDTRTALQAPNSVVISRTTARKYFGDETAIGKVIVFNATEPCKITGVYDDIPSNSHFHFDIFRSMTDWEPAKSDSWMGGSFYTYALLKPGSNLKTIEAKLPAMVEKYMGSQIQKSMGISLEQFRTKGNELGFKLQPLTSIHLYSATTAELEPAGNPDYVYIFGAIAIFMLLVACINFINLSTATASKRAKEVGVRKVIGSGKMQLVKQFLSESMLITMFALILAAVLVKLALPFFNDISGKQLSFTIWPVIALIALGIVVGLISGVYPAFYLSSFRPITVLKGKFTGSRKSFGLRSGLVVFQFFISVSLIIATVVVYQQMKFIQSKKLGYNKDQIITIPNSYALGGNEQAFKQEMLRDTRIAGATASWYKPAGPTNSNNALAYAEGHDDQILNAIDYHVDEDYIPTFEMQMLTGRNFSKAFVTDSFAMILNESAVKAFHWTATSAIGKNVIRVNTSRGSNIAYHIVGVVKDFNFKSLHQAISPLFITMEPEGGIIFKTKTADIAGLLATMKDKWNSYKTEEPFTYAFMDDLFNKTYAAERKTATILNIFSIFIIFVACLGLFGLATYTAEQRTKEIGIRKVLGASINQVTRMLSKEFVKLVAIASLIAFPVAWWAMNKWLESFAYRITISWWVFAIAGATTLLIALLTVSFQAIKAAIANPVRSLRAE